MACLTLREYINTVKTLKLLEEKEYLKICFKRKGITEYYFPSIKPFWDWENTDVGLKGLEKKGLLDLYVIFDCVLPHGMYVSLTERDSGDIYLNGLETLKIFKEYENENFDDFEHHTPKLENKKDRQQYRDFDDYLEKNRPRIQRKLDREANELKDKNNLSKKYSNKNSDKVSLVSLSIFVIGLILLILCFII